MALIYNDQEKTVKLEIEKLKVVCSKFSCPSLAKRFLTIQINEYENAITEALKDKVIIKDEEIRRINFLHAMSKAISNLKEQHYK